MSVFSSIYGSGFDFLASVAGGEVVYKPLGGQPIVDSGAIVGREQAIDRSHPNLGLVKVRRIEVSLRRSLVDAPQLSAKLVIAGEDWPIKGIVSRDDTITRVECELSLGRDASKGNHRPQV